jgi:hypothetical protein
MFQIAAADENAHFMSALLSALKVAAFHFLTAAEP